MNMQNRRVDEKYFHGAGRIEVEGSRIPEMKNPARNPSGIQDELFEDIIWPLF